MRLAGQTRFLRSFGIHLLMKLVLYEFEDLHLASLEIFPAHNSWVVLGYFFRYTHLLCVDEEVRAERSIHREYLRFWVA